MEKPGQKLKKTNRSNMTIVALADELHISRQAVYKRIGSYKKNKPGHSVENSAGHRPPHNRIPAETESIVVSVASKNKDDSILTLTSRLRENHGITLSPATVFRILKRNSVGKGSGNSPASFTPPVFPVEVFHSSLVSKVNSSSLLFGDVFSGRILRKIGSAILVLFVAVLSAHGVYRPLNDTRPVSFAVGTGSAMSTPDFYYPQLASISALPQIGDGIFDRFAPSLGSFSSYEFWQGIRIASKGVLSIVRDMPNTRQSSFKDVNRGMVLGISVSAETSDSGFRKSTVPFVDRISLSLYCSLASFSSSVDASRCDYGAIAEGRVGTQLAVDSEQLAVNTGNTSASVATTTVASVATAIPVFKALNQTFTNSSPIYITKYITEYVGIPGPAGSDGRDGKDGTNGTNGLTVSSTQIQPSYSGFIYPTTPTTPIGISTIGYLKDTTIDTPTINGGSAANFSLSAPTLTNAVFNGLSLFSDQATFTGSVAVNNFTATSSNFLDVTLTNSTTTNAYITDLTTLRSTLTNLTVTNSTTTNAYVESLTVGTSTAGALTLNGDLTVNGTATLATTTATDFIALNATSSSFFSSLLTALTGIVTDLIATNATTTNLVTENSTTTNAYISNLRIGNQEAGDATFTNATTTNFFTQNLAVGNASIQGNQSIDGAFSVTGTSTLGANVFLNGSVVIGTSTNEMFTINSLVNSNFVPAQNKVYDIGSPSFYWRDAYVDNLNVNTLSAASSTISGTSNNIFTINSDNATSDAEDSSMVFFRGLVTPNALLRWDSSHKRLESNMSLSIQNETPSVGTTTLSVLAGAGQNTTNLFELLNYAGTKLSVFNANGWLGLGSSTPGSMLTVVGTSTLATTTINGVLTVNGNTNINQGGTLTVGDKVIAPGEIGAGTSSPSGKISIQNTLTDQVAFLIYGSSTQNAPLIDVFDYPGSNQSIFRVSPIGLITGKQINISGTSTFATAGGSVGIGMTTPSAKLDVAGNVLIERGGSSDVQRTLTIGGAKLGSGGEYSRLDFQNYDSNGLAADYVGARISSQNTSGSDVGDLRFWTMPSSGGSLTERMTILNNGNVGIGTTTPAAKMHISGGGMLLDNNYFLNSYRTDGVLVNLIGLDTNNFTSIHSSGSSYGVKVTNTVGGELLTILNNGNVGIGTTTPDSSLTISGVNSPRISVVSAGGGSGAFQMNGYVNYDSQNSYGWTGYNGYNIIRGRTYNGYGDVYVGRGDAISIMGSSGNVGIGTTSPSSLLHLSKNTGSEFILDTVGGTNANSVISFYENTVDRGSIYWDGLANDFVWESSLGDISLMPSGNVGIGTTTPNALLDISSSNPIFRLTDSDAGYATISGNGSHLTFSADPGNTQSGSRIAFETDGTEKMRLSANGGFSLGSSYVGTDPGAGNMIVSGNVGIGTTSPDYKMDVYGGAVRIANGSGSNTYATRSDGVVFSRADLTGNYLNKITNSFSGTNGNTTMNFELTNTAGSGFTTIMSLNGNGNVGIGTTTPYAKLTVSGGVRVGTNSGTDFGYLLIRDSNGTYGAANSLVFRSEQTNGTGYSFQNTTGSSLVQITNAGGVGIGTTSPAGNLEVYSQTGSSTINVTGYNHATIPGMVAQTVFRNNRAVTGGYDFASVGLYMNPNQTYNFGDLVFNIKRGAGDTSLSEVVRITNSGNIGVGTSTPGAYLPSGWNNSASSRLLELTSLGDNFDSGIFLRRNDSMTGLDLWSDNSSGDVFIDNYYNHINGDIRFRTKTSGTPVDAVTITGSGNVGIGTTSPTVALDVTGQAILRYANPSLQFTPQTNTGAQQLIFNDYSGNVTGRIQYYVTGPGGVNNFMALWTAGVERMRIDGSGNVGIGTTTPSELLNLYASSGSKSILLNTAGGNSNATIKLQNDAQTWEFGNFGSSGDAYQIRNSGKIPFAVESNASSDSLYISSAGNVGIGTTTPTYKLDILQSANTTGARISYPSGSAALHFLSNIASSGDIYFGDSGSATAGAIRYFHSEDSMRFYTNGATARMALNSSGNLGIGTTSPAARLDISDGLHTMLLGADNGVTTRTDGAIKSVRIEAITADLSQSPSGILFVNNDATANNLNFGGGSSLLSAATNINFYTATTTGVLVGTARMTINKDGNIGVGVTGPNAKLDVLGDIQIRQSGQSYGLLRADNVNYGTGGAIQLNASNTAADQYIAFGTTPSGSTGQATFTEKMRVLSSGNIGIGTTTPGAKLHIENNTSANIGQYIVNTSTGSAAAEIIYLSEEGTPATKAGALFHTNTNYNDTGIVGPSGTYLDSFDVNGLWLGSRNSLGEVHLFTGGSAANNERMTITSSGNIGVGTTTPVSKLHVAAAPADYITAVFTDTRSSSIRGPHLGFSDGAGGAATIGMLFGGTDYRDKAMEIRTAVGGRINFYKDNSTTEGNLLMTMLSNGNVGIGTTSPDAKLMVSTSDSTQLRLHRDSNTVGTATNLTFALDDSLGNPTNYASIQTLIVANNDGAEKGKLSFNTAAIGGVLTQRMVIDDTGNVGIGTTTPGANLHIKPTGNATTFRIDNGVGNKTHTTWSATNGGYFSMWDGSDNETVRIDGRATAGANSWIATTGNVGIGTTEPGRLLDVAGIMGWDGTHSSEVGWLSATDTSNAAIFATTDLALYTNGGNTRAMHLEASGNIGIGTTTPGVRLVADTANSGVGDVAYFLNSSRADDSYTTIKIGQQVATGKAGIIGYNHAATTTNSYLWLANQGDDGNAGVGLIVKKGGLVGIGTSSPVHKLEVITNGSSLVSRFGTNQTAGHIYFTNASSTDDKVRVGADKTDLVLSTNYLERMRVTSTGNVGIGTTNPQAPLDLGSIGNAQKLLLYQNGNTRYGFGAASGQFRIFNPGMGNTTVFGSVSTVDGTTFTEQVRIDGGSGNVGIGTTNPLGKLEIEGGADSAPATSGTSSDFIFRYSPTGTNLALDFGGSASGGVYSWIQSRNAGSYSSNYALALNPNGGNVGIGTTSPNGALHVYRAAAGVQDLLNIQNNMGTNSGSRIVFNNSYGNIAGIKAITSPGGGSLDNEGDLIFQTATNSSLVDQVTIKYNGYVGIGTTSPTSKLDIADGNVVISNAYGYQARLNTGVAANLMRYSSSNYAIIGPNDELRLAGSVWIEPPTNGNIIIQGGTADSASAVGTIISTRNTLSTVGAKLLSVRNVSTEKAFIDKDGGAYFGGNTGIGTTSPAVKLHVNEASGVAGSYGLRVSNTGITSAYGEFTVDSANGVIKLLASGSSYPMAFNVNGSEQMRITTAGNVGIGTSTPGSKLDVWSTSNTSDVAMFRIVTAVGGAGNVKFSIDSDGDILTDGGTTIGSPADVAESYSALEAVDAGTVVAFGSTTIAWSSVNGSDTANASSSDIYEIAGVRKALDGYEAVGVVSTRPGLHLGADIQNGVPVALSGRVPVKVTTENGPVLRGDYLTVSPTRPGYAMKLIGEGRSIGRALSDYQEGRDKVMMMVENGYQKLNTAGRYATTTGMLTTGNIDLNANGVAIYNIKSLASANGTWSIDENGRITAKMLCLEDVCIDKTQLSNMLNSTGQVGTVISDQSSVSSSTDTGMVAGTSTQSTDNGTQSTGSTSTDAGISNDSIINIQTSDTTNTVTSDTASTTTSDPSTTTITDITTTPTEPEPEPIDTTVIEPLPDPEPVAIEPVPIAEPIAEPAA